MSTRKRTRSSLNLNDDEDELSPSKPSPPPLSAIKKRKLNTYGKTQSAGIFDKLGGLFTLGQSGRGKENAAESVEKDELAEDDKSQEEKEEGDIWEVPDDEELDMQRRDARGTASSIAKGTPVSQRKLGSAESAKQMGSAKSTKKDIYEVDDSEEETSGSSSVQAKQSIDNPSKTLDFTSKSKKQGAQNSTSKRPVGRPSKQRVVEKSDPEPEVTPRRRESPKTNVPSPKRSAGKMRKADILKKAKALSREAVFHQMMEAGKKAAAEGVEDAQISRRRRSNRAAQSELKEDADRNAEVTKEVKTSVSSPSQQSRPKKKAAELSEHVLKVNLTPTKNRTLESRKSVAFETRGDIDLGFKDLHEFENKTSTSNRGRKPKEVSQDDIEEPSTKVSTKKTKGGDLVEEIAEPEQGEEFEEDDGFCAICKGLDSKKGNEMILCENCDFAVHLKCYDIPTVPKGYWFCRECQPDDEDHLGLEDDDVAVSEVFKDLPEIEGLEDHLRHMQRVLLDRLTGQKRIKLRGYDEELRKLHQVVEQTVLAGEGNSMLVIGARGCGKTTLVESVISDLSTNHREKFHVVRLNGFIHTDDKLALKEIWRQLGREMNAENEMSGKANHADTLASLLALLSHPSEISEDQVDKTAKSVVFVLDEFDLFTTHPRQTLLYNLFDIAQARKAPIIVLGLTTRIDVMETLEKRVKSRFSHRYVHLSLPRSLPAFWEVCKEGLLVGTDDLENEGFDLGIPGQDEFVSFWRSTIDDLYNEDAAFKDHLQSHFFKTKSVPTFFASCILPIANLSARNLPLTGRKFTSSTISLSAPDSKLHILQGLSELELALLIAAARLDIILDTDTCNFAMAYDEYSSLTSRHKIQTSSTGVTALGASAKVLGRDVALGAWERLAEYNLVVPAGIGCGSARDFGAGGRMWKVDVGLEEIRGSVESLSGVMAKWCREI